MAWGLEIFEEDTSDEELGSFPDLGSILVLASHDEEELTAVLGVSEASGGQIISKLSGTSSSNRSSNLQIELCS